MKKFYKSTHNTTSSTKVTDIFLAVKNIYSLSWYSYMLLWRMLCHWTSFLRKMRSQRCQQTVCLTQYVIMSLRKVLFLVTTQF